MVRIRDGGTTSRASSYLDRSNHSVSSIRSMGSAASNGSLGSQRSSTSNMSVRSDGRVRDGRPRNATFKRSKSQVITRNERRQLPPTQKVVVNQNNRRKLNSRGKGVSFGVIEIREHAITLGDNPGSLGGPPITISWQAQDHTSLLVDEYERMRPTRRTIAEMNIPETIRADMLRKAGHTRAEIQQAIKAANIARRQRKQTVAAMELGPIHEFGESLLRGGKNIMNRGKKKQEKEQLMQAMQQVQMHQQAQRQQTVNHRPAPAKPLAPEQNPRKYSVPSKTTTKPAAYGQHSQRRPAARPPAPSTVQAMNSIAITDSDNEEEC